MWAALIGIAVALALPKRVEHVGARCTTYEVEPFGAYLIESAIGRGLGVAYASGEDCR